jgi:hypothetical protein
MIPSTNILHIYIYINAYPYDTIYKHISASTNLWHQHNAVRIPAQIGLVYLPQGRDDFEK